MSMKKALESQREHNRNGILAEIAQPLTPGSPAYVRALRDRAAVASLPLASDLMTRDADAQKVVMEKIEHEGTSPQEITSMLAATYANALILALGYEVPEENS